GGTRNAEIEPAPGRRRLQQTDKCFVRRHTDPKRHGITQTGNEIRPGTACCQSPPAQLVNLANVPVFFMNNIKSGIRLELEELPVGRDKFPSAITASSLRVATGTEH